MLKGVDISNWQAGIVPSNLGVQFCIVKATEGVGFTDKQCDKYIQNCKAHGILWGYYHFARPDLNSAEAEAEFFYKQTKSYTGQGIPVLDYEVWGRVSDAAWCEKWLTRYHELTGIWAMIYISASQCAKFKGSWIPEKCGLWVAGYPKTYTSWPDSKVPYNIAPWTICAIWQFTSSLKLPAWNDNLDGDYAYMDAAAWKKYAGSSSTAPAPAPATPDYEQLAREVWEGKWGNGWNRKNALDTAYGAGSYDKVQAIVNKGVAPDYDKLASEVIKGYWGNYPQRKQLLDAQYGPGTYEKVQKIVNASIW